MSDSPKNILMKNRTTSEYFESEALKEAVGNYMKENPEKIKKAQSFGDYIMDSQFANVDTFEINTDDIEGDKILCQKLIHDIKFYGISISELNEHELNVLKRRYGENWKQKFNLI
jgi:hypothetical protein